MLFLAIIGAIASDRPCTVDGMVSRMSGNIVQFPQRDDMVTIEEFNRMILGRVTTVEQIRYCLSLIEHLSDGELVDKYRHWVKYWVKPINLPVLSL